LTPQSQINEWLVTVYNSLSAKTYLKKILCYIAEHLAWWCCFRYHRLFI